jgi:cytochrome P450
MAFPGAVATTVDHYLHRSRRSYLNPYFSKRAIYALEPSIRERITKLCQRFETLMAEKQVVVLDKAFSALTADIITHYIYGEHYDYLDIPDFTTTLNSVFYDIAKGANFARFFPSFALLRKLPLRILRILSPGIADLLLHQEDIKNHMTAIMLDTQSKNSNSGMLESLVHDNIPAEERQLNRILNEGAVILLAGTETTARTLSVAFFYLLQDTTHLASIRTEVNAVRSFGKTPSLSELEHLPYLVSQSTEVVLRGLDSINRSIREVS